MSIYNPVTCTYGLQSTSHGHEKTQGQSQHCRINLSICATAPQLPYLAHCLEVNILDLE